MNYKYVIFASANEIQIADFSLLENKGMKIFFLYSELKQYSDMVNALDKEKKMEFAARNKFINSALANKTAQVIGNGVDLLEYQGMDILLRAYKKGNIAIVVTNPDAYPRFQAFKVIYNDAGFALDIDTFANLFGGAKVEKPEQPQEEKKVEEAPQQEEQKVEEKPEQKVEEPKQEEKTVTLGEKKIVVQEEKVEEQSKQEPEPKEEKKEEDDDGDIFKLGF